MQTNRAPQLTLLHRQQLNRRRKVWREGRQQRYDQRDHERAQLQDRIAVADASKVDMLKQELQRIVDRHMQVIRRYNAGAADCVGGAAIQIAAAQYSAAAQAVFALAVDDLDVLVALSGRGQTEQALQAFVTALPWPPATTIRSTPRRPGAPSSVLRLNH